MAHWKSALRIAAMTVLAGTGAEASTAAPSGTSEGTVVSERARSQLDAARRHILAEYGTPEKAMAAGWRRPRSSTPTMGEHWLNPALRADSSLDPLMPEVLMFAPIKGEVKLVGAAWIKQQPADAPIPILFDGLQGTWHRHDSDDPLALAIGAAGLRGRPRNAMGIVMNHLWFVDAHGGEFTGHNHWLPFLDAGLAAPPASIKGELLGRAALALAEANGSAAITTRAFERLPLSGRAEVAKLRQEIRTLMPNYARARSSNDKPAMIAALEKMGGLWNGIRAIHSRDLRPEVGRLLTVAYGNMLGGHEHGSGHVH